MATANFRTMENFPLFALDTSDMEWWETEDVYRDLERVLDELNDGYLFHEVKVASGYYTGLQFYVEENFDPNEMDNEDCRYEFDLYRSQAIRRYESEQNKITRTLRKLAGEHGFREYYCAGVFGNGEAIYNEVKNDVRSRVRRAATEVRVTV